MTESECFLDTNLWVYLYSTDPKAETVERLIQTHFDDMCVSIQVLNELYHVLTRKRLRSLTEAQIIINDLIENYTVCRIDEQCIKLAITINIRYHFAYWDSLIIAAALEAGCATLYSEDLQHKQVIEGTLTILNPFLTTVND